MTKHRDKAFNVIYGYKCNYSCVGCCNGSDYVTSGQHDPDIDKILESIEKLPSIIEIDPDGMITLLGGEPMMYWHDRIVPIAKSLRRAFPQAKINIFSNGHLANRFVDDIVELLDQENCDMTISRHLAGDMSSVLGTKWKDNIGSLVLDPRVTKVHDNHYHIKNNIRANIHFYQADEWFTWYQLSHDGKIKPWATNDPKGSIKYGCASGSSCSALFENRLYKCGSLAMLKGFLSARQQLDDHDWKKYLDYPYVDVLDIDQDKFDFFKSTYGKDTTYCDMCNNKPTNIIKWTDRTQSMIIQKR